MNTERYRSALADMPESGGGGCHTALLGVANRGIRAGRSAQEVFDDLRAALDGVVSRLSTKSEAL
jgi:hypothetical protein